MSQRNLLFVAGAGFHESRRSASIMADTLTRAAKPAGFQHARSLRMVALCLLLAGCTGGMSSQIRREAYPIKGLEELRQRVNELIGETVILGGQIIDVRNESMDSTTLLILDRPLGYDRKPNLEGQSGGRFMVRFDRYLDPEIYKVGMAVTVAGTVKGTVEEPVGKAPYKYVVLQGREIHLWKNYGTYYYDYPSYPFYYPFGRYDFYPYYWPYYW